MNRRFSPFTVKCKTKGKCGGEPSNHRRKKPATAGFFR